LHFNPVCLNLNILHDFQQGVASRGVRLLLREQVSATRAPWLNGETYPTSKTVVPYHTFLLHSDSDNFDIKWKICLRSLLSRTLMGTDPTVRDAQMSQEPINAL